MQHYLLHQDLVTIMGRDGNQTTAITIDYVIDYTSALKNALIETETGGVTYRYTYGLEKLSAVVYGIISGAGSVQQTYSYPNGSADVVKLWYNHSRLGTTDFLTDNVQGKVTSYTAYDDWGALTMKTIIKLGTRELDLVTEYTVHKYDPVLGVYFARARMYDAADRRFMAVDWVKGWIQQPASLVQYTYVLDNPVIWVDPSGNLRAAGFYTINGVYAYYYNPDAAEFRIDSDTYKILLDLTTRWENAEPGKPYETTLLWGNGVVSEIAMDRSYYSQLACRVRENARKDNENVYRQDEVMDLLHENAGLAIEYQNSMLLGRSGLWFALSGKDYFLESVAFLIGMAEGWGNYKFDEHWQVPFDSYEGNKMNVDNNKNWKEWIYFDGRLVSADDLGNMNMAYVGVKMHLPRYVYQNRFVNDNKDAYWVQYGITLAENGR